MICCHNTSFANTNWIRDSYYSAHDAHLATAPQHILTQHDMLPQHLVCKYELNCEYCNITLPRNKAPWWWSDNVETCRSVLKAFYVKLYVHSLVGKLKSFYKNARCYNKIYKHIIFCLLLQTFLPVRWRIHPTGQLILCRRSRPRGPAAGEREVARDYVLCVCGDILNWRKLPLHLSFGNWCTSELS